MRTASVTSAPHLQGRPLLIAVAVVVMMVSAHAIGCDGQQPGPADEASTGTAEGGGDASGPDATGAPDGDLSDAGGPEPEALAPWCVPPGGGLRGEDEACPLPGEQWAGLPSDLSGGMMVVDVTDASDLVAAVDAASAGTIIRLAAGDYALEDTLDVPGGVLLRGACAALTRLTGGPDGAPALRFANTAGALDDTCPAIGPSESVNVVWGVGFVGVQLGIEANMIGTLVVHQATFEGCERAMLVTNSQRAVLSHVRVSGAGSTASAFQSAVELSVGQFTVRDSLFAQTPGVAIMTLQSSGSVAHVTISEAGLAGAVFKGAGVQAVAVDAVDVVDIAAPVGSAQEGYGVVATDLSLDVSDATVSGTPSAGLLLAGGVHTISSVVIDSAGVVAVQVGPLDDGTPGELTLSDATLSNADNGVFVFGSAAHLSSVTIHDVTHAGVQVARCAAAAPCGTSHSPLEPPTSLDDPAEVQLEEVSLMNVGVVGVRAHGADVSIVGGAVSGSARYGVLATESSVLRVDGLTIDGAFGAGIALRGASDALRIRDTTISDIGLLLFEAPVDPAAPSVQAGLLLQDGSSASVEATDILGAGPCGVGTRGGGALSALRQDLGSTTWLSVTGSAFTGVEAGVCTTELQGTHFAGNVLGAATPEVISLAMPPGNMPAPPQVAPSIAPPL